MVLDRPKIFRKSGKQRQGKGFSSDELKKVGLSLGEAVRLHIPVDPRRKTVHEENVEAVKAFLDQKREAAKPKPKKPKRKSKS
jgi:large subunit ribosomal protein L13e